MASSKAVSKLEEVKGSSEVANFNDFVDEMDPNDSEFSADDVAVPRLVVLQDLSPQTKKTKPEFVEGAKPGMFYNTATQRLYDGEQGIIVIPCAFRPSFVEWQPNRGGFVADRSDEPGIKELWQRAFANRKSDPSGKNQCIIATGNVLDRTADHYVLVAPNKPDVTAADFEEAVLTLRGSQMKKSRMWNSKVQAQEMARSDGRRVRVIAPAYAYKVMTKEESNDDGTWAGVVISDLGSTGLIQGGKQLFERGKGFRALVLEGKRRAMAEQHEDTTGPSEDLPF